MIGRVGNSSQKECERIVVAKKRKDNESETMKMKERQYGQLREQAGAGCGARTEHFACVCEILKRRVAFRPRNSKSSPPHSPPRRKRCSGKS